MERGNSLVAGGHMGHLEEHLGCHWYGGEALTGGTVLVDGVPDITGMVIGGEGVPVATGIVDGGEGVPDIRGMVCVIP